METDIDIVVDQDPATGDLRHVVMNLIAFNESQAPASGHRPLTVFARERGKIVGGASGYTHWTWLFVSHLWIEERLRRQGVGKRLLAAIEEAAHARGCAAVHLDTHSFQARGFYEGLGYTQFGELPDYPPGHSRHFLWKKL